MYPLFLITNPNILIFQSVTSDGAGKLTWGSVCRLIFTVVSVNQHYSVLLKTACATYHPMQFIEKP